MWLVEELDPDKEEDVQEFQQRLKTLNKIPQTPEQNNCMNMNK